MGIAPEGAGGARSVPTRGPWSRAEAERFLAETVVPLRLGCVDGRGWPVVLSLWYLYRDGAIWCATRPGAAVVRYLEREGRCAFEVAPETPPYRGVRGQGTAAVNRGAGGALLGELLVRYLGTTATALGRRLLARADEEVAIRIEPVRLSSWDYRARMDA